MKLAWPRRLTERCGSKAREALESSGEMTLIGETGGKGDFNYWCVGGEQLPTREVNPPPTQIIAWRAAAKSPKDAY